MPCGCGKKVAGTPVKYEVTLPNNSVISKDTETEARLAIVRAGGGSYKPVSASRTEEPAVS